LSNVKKYLKLSEYIGHFFLKKKNSNRKSAIGAIENIKINRKHYCTYLSTIAKYKTFSINM